MRGDVSLFSTLSVLQLRDEKALCRYFSPSLRRPRFTLRAHVRTYINYTIYTYLLRTTHKTPRIDKTEREAKLGVIVVRANATYKKSAFDSLRLSLERRRETHEEQKRSKTVLLCNRLDIIEMMPHEYQHYYYGYQQRPQMNQPQMNQPQTNQPHLFYPAPPPLRRSNMVLFPGGFYQPTLYNEPRVGPVYSQGQPAILIVLHFWILINDYKVSKNKDMHS